VIVQVGSALAYRGIPLQAAYLGRTAPLMHGPASTVSNSGPTRIAAGLPSDLASPAFSTLPWRGAGAKQ